MSRTDAEPRVERVAPAVRRTPRRAWLTGPVSLAALLLCVVLSLALGARATPITEVTQALLGFGDVDVANIVGTLRVNRTVTGLIAGASLGVAGDIPRGARFGGYPAQPALGWARETALLKTLVANRGKKPGAAQD